VSRVHVHGDAVADLNALRPRHPGLVRRILVTLEEIQDDPSLLEGLLQHGFGEGDDNEPIGIKKWLRHWNTGRDLWRLKIWQLENAGVSYRIIYGYRKSDQTFHVLAVRPRKEVNYDDPKDVIGQRIVAAYEGL